MSETGRSPLWAGWVAHFTAPLGGIVALQWAQHSFAGSPPAYSNQLEDERFGWLEGRHVHALGWLPRHFPSNVRLLVSSLDGDVMRALRQRSWSHVATHPLSADDCVEFVRWTLSRVSKSLTTAQVRRRPWLGGTMQPAAGAWGRDAAVRGVSDPLCSNGLLPLARAQVAVLLRNEQTQNPLFLSLVLEELVAFGVFERIEQELESLAASPSISELLQKIFARLERSFDVSLPVPCADPPAFGGGTIVCRFVGNLTLVRCQGVGPPGLVALVFKCISASQWGMTEWDLLTICNSVGKVH